MEIDKYRKLPKKIKKLMFVIYLNDGFYKKLSCNMCTGIYWIILMNIGKYKCCESDCKMMIKQPYVRCNVCSIKHKKCGTCDKFTNVYYYNPFAVSDWLF